jgi:GT2 family glycosyltransferase
MVTYGGWRWTRQALEALRDHTADAIEVVIVDNRSPDGTADHLRDEVRGATVIANDRNVGFGPAANRGADRAGGTHLVFLNPDCIVTDGWLPPLLEALEGRPSVGAAVPRLMNVDGSLQEAGGLLFADGRTMLYGDGADARRPRYRFPRYVDYGSAACLAIPRKTFLALGGFDPRYLPAYCEDVDLLLSLRATGLRTWFEPRSEVVHVRYGSSVPGEDRMAMSRRNTAILRRRWATVLAARPPLPQDPTDVHLVLAARDVEATDRILVVADRVPERLLLSLARLNRLGRVTYLHTGFRSLRAEVAEPLVAAGIEVEGPLDEPDAWWRERLFHYTAVVVPGTEPTWLRRRLHETQPQASLIAGADPDAIVGELRRVGLFAERVGSGSQPAPIG